MRNKTLFLYNGTRANQDWNVYSAGIINQSYIVGQTRKSFTISLSGNATIQFGVDSTVYLTATYTYATDSWTSHSDTPNEFSFIVSQSAVSVTCNFQAAAQESNPTTTEASHKS